MQLSFFSIPALDGTGEAEALNRFLASHRVLSIDSQLVPDGQSSFWAVRVHHEPAKLAKLPSKKGRIDYKEVLSPEDFSIYSALRELRKQVAEREAVPVYQVFSNEQLAALVTGRPTTRTALLEIEGVGVARADRYGAEFLEALGALPAASRRPATVPAAVSPREDADAAQAH